MPEEYSLIGPTSRHGTLDQQSVEGRPRVKWWQPKVDEAEFIKLREVSDWPAMGNFALWFTLLILSGTLAYASWGTWWAVPAFLIYGTIHASSDARWHELGHGTVFKTKWLNSSLYQLCSFMTFREAYLWRYSHTRHHSHTIIVGHDPEIQVQRPADLVRILLDFFHIPGGFGEIKRITRHAVLGLGEEEKQFVPERARNRLIFSSRIYVFLWLAIISWSIAAASWLPAMLLLMPRFYGGWLHQLLGLTQHAGLAENVSDHRQNTRTLYINPVFRFLYMNMNYHLEHHVSPTVPYHALPHYHALIKDQCPEPYKSVAAAYREIVPVLWQQAFGDPDTFAKREVPREVIAPAE